MTNTSEDWLARVRTDLPFVLKAKAHMLKKGIRAGWRKCPNCGAKVHIRLAPNNHVRAWCDTPGCIRMME